MKTKAELIKDHDLLVVLHNKTANETKAQKYRDCIKQIKKQIKSLA